MKFMIKYVFIFSLPAFDEVAIVVHKVIPLKG